MKLSPILADLFAPLRYASRDGGARAHSLKGVGQLCERLVQRAVRSGASLDALTPLLRAARAFDEAKETDKAQALRALVAALGDLIPLPDDLAATLGKSAPLAPPAERLVLEQSPVKKDPKAAAGSSKAASSKRREASSKAASPTPASHSAHITVPAFAGGLASQPLTTLHGVGPRLEEQLRRKGIGSVAALLFHVPRGYQDRRKVDRIADLVPNQPGLVLATVRKRQEIFNRRSRRKILRVVVEDESGTLALTFFHYWAATLRRLEPGTRLYAWGDVKLFGGSKQIVHPELDEAQGEGPSRGIVPVYRGMDEVGQERYRKLVRQALDAHLDEVVEVLPESLRAHRRLPGIREALRALHAPPLDADFTALATATSPWHRRLAYEEFFLLSTGLALKARGIQVEPGHAFDVTQEKVEKAIGLLPFTPTGAQRRAIEAIAEDMARPEPMNRLLQGDVGSGKTAVALVASLLAVWDGRQAAVMAPTELLAEQHAQNFRRWLEPQGMEPALLVAGRGNKALEEARTRAASGRAQVVVGTQALMTAGTTFADLGLVIIDEQHRFGVAQRAELIAKGKRPDVLVMTATPIPRTLALVLHGEMSQTVLDELPPGRTPVETRVFAKKDRERMFGLLERELAAGRQAYVVYPLIEESERSDLEDATRGLADLQKRFPGRRLALLHGKMKADERDAVMASFREGEVDLLVSTTVVEVGVDVPNATVMVVEHAERFGLSQLHQLRGRVGRGAAKSYCVLVDHGSGEGKAGDRLRTMERTTDGFEIARADLAIRGPGEFLGTRQAGLPELTFADLARDAALLELAREDAFALIREDPELSDEAHRLLRTEVFERFAERMSLARVG